jgi:acylphosphatase
MTPPGETQPDDADLDAPRAARAARARLDATIHGRVQGVGFRYFVLERALTLDLDGWVANESDGSVHCVAEGPRPVLEAFLQELEIGPPAAIVDRVMVGWEPARGNLGPFGVRTGGHRGD